jgi:hypothetical protein
MIPLLGCKGELMSRARRIYRHIFKVRYIALLETDTRLTPDDLYRTFVQQSRQASWAARRWAQAGVCAPVAPGAE